MYTIKLKNFWIMLFICIQVGGALLFISKNIVWIKALYKFQYCEKEYESLLKEKKQLLHEFYMLKNYNELKKYAQNYYGMDYIKRDRVKRIFGDTKLCS